MGVGPSQVVQGLDFVSFARMNRGEAVPSFRQPPGCHLLRLVTLGTGSNPMDTLMYSRDPEYPNPV